MVNDFGYTVGSPSKICCSTSRENIPLRILRVKKKMQKERENREYPKMKRKGKRGEHGEILARRKNGCPNEGGEILYLKFVKVAIYPF